jgi:hypothetical protein
MAYRPRHFVTPALNTSVARYGTLSRVRTGFWGWRWRRGLESLAIRGSLRRRRLTAANVAESPSAGKAVWSLALQGEVRPPKIENEHDDENEHDKSVLGRAKLPPSRVPTREAADASQAVWSLALQGEVRLPHAGEPLQAG